MALRRRGELRVRLRRRVPRGVRGARKARVRWSPFWRRWGVGGEEEEGAGPGGVVMVAADAGDLAGDVVHQGAGREVEVVGDVPGGDVVAEVGDVPVLGAEGQAADVGVQAVGADDQVEGTG